MQLDTEEENNLLTTAGPGEPTETTEPESTEASVTTAGEAEAA